MKLTAWEHFPYPVRKAWRIMRITTLLILVISLHLSAKTTAQKITLSSNDITIEQFFKQLKKQTGYSFLLENGVISKDEKISVNVKDVSLEMVLDQILKPINLSYKIENKTVYVQKAKDNLVVAISDNTPPGDIHGHVTDSLGNPLSGASILIKGTKKGTTTDVNGNFTLSGVKENAILNISFTGYIHKEFKWTGDASFNITLIRSNNPLDAVVVIPYGTTTQRLNTGDISTVTAKTIEEQPVGNVLAALEGRVPGLVVTQNTGMPGGSFTVQIRGQNSLLNGNDPFYVVDGVPYNSEIPGASQGNLLLNGALRGGSPLSYLNPFDIESIEVLKDADATAIYGSRAANGAILITTKKGKAGSTRVNLSLNSGFANVPNRVTLMNTQQYLEMRHEAFNNDNATPQPYNHDVNGDWDTTRYTDWQKVFFGNQAHYDDAELAFSGGNANTQFYIGGGYRFQTTPFPNLVPGQGSDKSTSMHFSINNVSTDQRLKISLTGSYSYDNNTVQSNDFVSSALTLQPNAPPLYNSDGTLNWAPLTPGAAGTWYNPLANFLKGYQGITSNVIGDGTINYTIIPGFTLKATLGYTNTQTNETQTQATTSFDPGLHIPSGYSSFNAVNSNSWIIEPQADYRVGLGKGILTALVGSTFHENSTSNQWLSATGFSSDALLNNIQAATTVTVQYANSTVYKYTALFGRINYNWLDKYLVNLTARRDGSSRFGPGKQFANFGAIGAAWIFTKENFIQNALPFLSFGKLRGSYGTSGNDQIGDYRFLDLWGPTQYPYQGIQALYPANLSNADLAWEVNKKLEGGLELGFFKERIVITASFFRNRSGNQLVTQPISAVTGFTSVAANLAAVVQNTGQEYVLRTVNIKNKNFEWSSSLNLSIPRNKLISFPSLSTSPYVNQYVVGQPTTIAKVFHSTGVNDTTGLYEFVDTKGTTTSLPQYTPDYLNTIINTAPKFYGGFENTFRYGNFSLGILFQFCKQIGPNMLGLYNYMPGLPVNQPSRYLDRWQEPGDSKPNQKFSQQYFGQAYFAFQYATYSNLAYGDASFIRLKNLAVSWELPENVNKRLRIRSCQIFVHGQNLLTITKYFGLDPETRSLALPPMRVYTFGIQLGL